MGFAPIAAARKYTADIKEPVGEYLIEIVSPTDGAEVVSPFTISFGDNLNNVSIVSPADGDEIQGAFVITFNAE